ncbi:Peroxyureidoacrylate/ureidoacrylate amidohydrolase RutB (plasmid) [Martelella mediterranea DSM 17316]|uniref:Peroxyureidoacrylate/ureidoacrylate amidohydrolase RutB n=2 Tax=Martelella mediterranea TaxID=293089 RepID=A0A1U9Z7X9_9HYPH|nr:Peroxyureidoacrylate/ureidoacrylate amidohydrolase RutB [Martelella mediterranea DSM 17316]
MHKFEMPQWATDRVLARQAAPVVHHMVPADKTALVVIDMQNHFLAPGAGGETPPAREIVPAINRLAASLRGAGGLVVWVRTLFSEGALLTLPHFHRTLLTPERFAARSAALAEESEGSALWPGLDVRKDDIVVGKTRYSAFIQGASDLDGILRARGIEAVVIAGTMTNACCESSARDAMMLNYRTTMVHDACASLRDDEHAAALVNFYLFFGDVTDTATLEARYAALHSTGNDEVRIA